MGSGLNKSYILEGDIEFNAFYNDLLAIRNDITKINYHLALAKIEFRQNNISIYSSARNSFVVNLNCILATDQDCFEEHEHIPLYIQRLMTGTQLAPAAMDMIYWNMHTKYTKSIISSFHSYTDSFSARLVERSKRINPDLRANHEINLPNIPRQHTIPNVTTSRKQRTIFLLTEGDSIE